MAELCTYVWLLPFAKPYQPFILCNSTHMFSSFFALPQTIVHLPVMIRYEVQSIGRQLTRRDLTGHAVRSYDSPMRYLHGIRMGVSIWSLHVQLHFPTWLFLNASVSTYCADVLSSAAPKFEIFQTALHRFGTSGVLSIAEHIPDQHIYETLLAVTEQSVSFYVVLGVSLEAHLPDYTVWCVSGPGMFTDGTYFFPCPLVWCSRFMTIR